MRPDYFDHLTPAADDRVPHGINALRRSIGKRNSKINLEVLLVPNGLRHQFENPAPIFGENTILETFYRRSILFRIKSKQVVYFCRPIHELLTSHIESPTAGMTETLGLGQIGLAASQFPFRVFCDCHICHRPEKLDDARCTSRGVSHSMDIFH